MGLLDTIKKVGTTLKNIVAPSAQLGAERRQAAFGTTSKVPAIIAGVAAGAAVAVAGAAGAGVLTAQVAKKAAVSVGTTALKAAKAVIPSTTKGKIVAAVATPVVVGAVASQPLGAAKIVAKAPGELAKFGSDIANLAADPSIDKAKELVEESPLITGAAALLGALSLAKGALLTAAAVKTLTNETESPTPVNIDLATEKPATFGNDGQSPTLPITPATETIRAGSSRRRYKKKKVESTRVTQRVNVVVQSKSTGISSTKRYLNKVAVLN